MSRSGYTDDGWDDPSGRWDMIRWRGRVTSSIRGKRGQKFLRDLIAALDAMPVKELIYGQLIDEGGRVCALGALSRHRGMDTKKQDDLRQSCEEDGDEGFYNESLACDFDVATPLIQELQYTNDEVWFQYEEKPTEQTQQDKNERRWRVVRAWAERHLNEANRTKP